MRLAAALASLVAASTVVAQEEETFTNPILYEDLADIDIIRVDDTFYYSASTMHYSPGAPILKSYDLVNWEYVGHSVPELAFGEHYYLNGSGSAYVGGIWASSIGYRESNGLFYWYGCIEESQTHIFTAEDPAGEWTQQEPIDECYYDVGLLIDEDDTMYLAYGRYNLSVVELSSDGLTPVREEEVWTDPDRYLEGARFYNINGSYYMWLTKPADEQHVLRADSPWGPYTERSVLEQMPAPIPHSGVPHQGGIVDTPNGDWYYMAFLDAYPNGRIPVLAPLRWDDEGWPHVVTDENGGWGRTYPLPSIETNKTVTRAGPYTDRFDEEELGSQWEWNHNPDNERWSLDGQGLVLSTATVTTDLHLARNTLSHRILGPVSSATFRLGLGSMAEGDVAGVALLRDESSFLGIQRTDDGLRMGLVEGVALEEPEGGGTWERTSNGTVVTTADVDLQDVATGTSDVWLRIVADVTPNFGKENAGEGANTGSFQYSFDGQDFQQVGPAMSLHARWQFFKAFRYAVFNYATIELGGSVIVREFDLRLVEEGQGYELA